MGLPVCIACLLRRSWLVAMGDLNALKDSFLFGVLVWVDTQATNGSSFSSAVVSCSFLFALGGWVRLHFLGSPRFAPRFVPLLFLSVHLPLHV